MKSRDCKCENQLSAARHKNDHGRRTDCAVWSRCVLAEDLREDFDGVGVLKRLECACISREVLDGFQHDDEEH